VLRAATVNSEREEAKRGIMGEGLGGMTWQDEHVVAYIAKLRTPVERSYAQRQWQYLRGKNNQPDHRQYGVQDGDAQEIRIRLAALR
jgi:hypothetical protein